MKRRQTLLLFIAAVILGIAVSALGVLQWGGHLLGPSMRQTVSTSSIPMIDNVLAKDLLQTPMDNPVFSPDHTRVAYVVDTSQGNYLIIDNTSFAMPKGSQGFAFSQDSKRLAFVTEDFLQNPPCCTRIVYKDRTDTSLSMTGDYASHDAVFAGLATMVGESAANAAAHIIRLPADSFNSPDGALTADITRSTCIITGGTCGMQITVTGKQRKTLFSKKYSAAYAFDGTIHDPTFSPDSRTIAYTVGNTIAGYFNYAGKGYVMVGNTRGPSYDAIVGHTLQFSADGTQISYCAIQGHAFLWVTENLPSSAFLR